MANKTIEFFKEINKIPRPSGKEEKIKDFLVNFAKNRNLECFFDKTNNVIIKKQGNNNKGTLILQAHSDMVCEKEAGLDFNFDKDAIKTKVCGDYLLACKTTLGADNGVGLSMILSVLDDTNLDIPNLECVFTAQEETTMQGAKDLDFSKLKGKFLLSLDGSCEGEIEVSSAGMRSLKFFNSYNLTIEDENKTKINSGSDIKEKNITTNKIEEKNKNCKLENKNDCNNIKIDKINKNEQTTNNGYKISVGGFRGGHSGTEINTDKQNAIKVLFENLGKLKNVILSSIKGGGKDNAIPRECECEFLTNSSESEIKKIFEKAKNNSPEKDFTFKIEKVKTYRTLSESDSNNIINFINNQKNGVVAFSEIEKNFPIVSNNLANISLVNGQLRIIISVRSSVKKLESEYLQDLNIIANKFKINKEELSFAPYFERQENSYLQKLCIKTYKDLFNKEALAKGVHAGLEGGVFASKKNLDICVISPNIYNAHSPMEKVSLSSINRVYCWLEKIVTEFNNN